METVTASHRMRRVLLRVAGFTVAIVVGSLVVTLFTVYAQGGVFRVASDCAAMTPAPPTGTFCLQLTTGRPKTFWYTGTAWAQMGFEDTVGTTVVLDVLGERATVALAGQNGAIMTIPASVTFAGTLVVVISTDGGTSWEKFDHQGNPVGVFVNAAGVSVATLTFPIGTPANRTVLSLYSALPATHIGVEVTLATSGSASTTVRAMNMQPISTMVGAKSTGLLPVAITDGAGLHSNLRTAAGVELGTVGTPLRVDGTLASNTTTASTSQFAALTAIASTTTPTHTTGRGVALSTDLSGNLRVTVPESGTSICSGRTILSGASTNSTLCKNAAGIVYGVTVTNVNASNRYLKLYDSATAPTCGSGSPKLTLLIPGGSAGHSPNLPADGVAFATGIGLCLTTGVGDSDTGAVAANEILPTVLFR